MYLYKIPFFTAGGGSSLLGPPASTNVWLNFEVNHLFHFVTQSAMSDVGHIGHHMRPTFGNRIRPSLFFLPQAQVQSRISGPRSANEISPDLVYTIFFTILN